MLPGLPDCRLAAAADRTVPALAGAAAACRLRGISVGALYGVFMKNPVQRFLKAAKVAVFVHFLNYYNRFAFSEKDPLRVL